ncbi:hypothetical protein [Massilia sp. DD77]|uniref:hypothetical protein n=1 Tax=Massilia sp. DD77 TaxID=3109349 RepID=UPI003000D55A
MRIHTSVSVSGRCMKPAERAYLTMIDCREQWQRAWPHRSGWADVVIDDTKADPFPRSCA